MGGDHGSTLPSLFEMGDHARIGTAGFFVCCHIFQRFKSSVRMKPSILITGASGGIGQSLVAKLADHFQIYATGRKSERLRSFPKRFVPFRGPFL